MSDTAMPNAGTAEAMTVADIQRHVSSALASFATKAGDAKDARAAANDASDAAIGERERIITSLAALSHKHAWDNDYLATAVKGALNARNTKDASINTFASEIRNMAARNVRRHVAGWFKLAHDAFDAEKAVMDVAKAKKEQAASPCRKAFSRAYHAVVLNMRKAAIDDGRTFASVDDVREFALDTLRSREIDTARVAKRLKAIIAELRDFASDFPVEGITTCVEFLGEVTEGDLRQCLKGASATDDASEPESEPEGEPESEPAPQTIDDMVEGALADMVA